METKSCWKGGTSISHIEIYFGFKFKADCYEYANCFYKAIWNMNIAVYVSASLQLIKKVPTLLKHV